MANIDISTSAVRARATKLVEESSQFRTLTNDLYNKIGDMSSIWTTQAQKDFALAAESHRDLLNNIAAAIEGYGDYYSRQSGTHGEAEGSSSDASSRLGRM